VYLRFQGYPPYPNLTEADIRDSFYASGEIVSVRPQPDKGQAFVEYTQPAAAELAIASMNRKELLGRIMYTSWARAPDTAPPRFGDPQDQPKESSAVPTVVRPVAPPGLLGQAVAQGVIHCCQASS
jgi:RNA recognition motif-containing protein